MAKVNRLDEMMPLIVRELKAFRYGEKDIDRFFNSQQGKHLVNRVDAIYRDSIADDEDKKKNVINTARNAYVNYRVEAGKMALSLIKSRNELIELIDEFKKSMYHKYIRREGTKGNYKYFYRDENGKEVEGKKPEEAKNTSALKEEAKKWDSAEAFIDSFPKVYRSGLLDSGNPAGVFLSENEWRAKLYEDLNKQPVKEYYIDKKAKIKEATTRDELLQELDPRFNDITLINRLYAEEEKVRREAKKQGLKGYKLPENMTARQRYETKVEQRIAKKLKGEYDGVLYNSEGQNDQKGEYQVFNKDVILTRERLEGIWKEANGVDKSLDLKDEQLTKGKKFPIGTIRNWQGKDYKKINDKEWELVSNKVVGQENKEAEKVDISFEGISNSDKLKGITNNGILVYRTPVEKESKVRREKSTTGLYTSPQLDYALTYNRGSDKKEVITSLIDKGAKIYEASNIDEEYKKIAGEDIPKKGTTHDSWIDSLRRAEKVVAKHYKDKGYDVIHFNKENYDNGFDIKTGVDAQSYVILSPEVITVIDYIEPSFRIENSDNDKVGELVSKKRELFRKIEHYEEEKGRVLRQLERLKSYDEAEWVKESKKEKEDQISKLDSLSKEAKGIIKDIEGQLGKETSNNIKFVETTKKSLKNQTPTFSGWELEDRYSFQGLGISVENKKGSVREWRDRNGKTGETKMLYDYGYIRNTLSNKDKDHVDCYIKSKDSPSTRVFIVHQQIGGVFDEDKVMLGFESPEEAKEAYLAHYSDASFYGGMDEMSMDEFKDKVIGKKVDKIEKAKELERRVHELTEQIESYCKSKKVISIKKTA